MDLEDTFCLPMPAPSQPVTCHTRTETWNPPPLMDQI
jgi:hypothetical protein